MKKFILSLGTLLSVSLLVFATPTFASSNQTLMLGDNTEIQADVYGKPSATRVLWIAPNYGLKARHQQVASLLADTGLEVWQVDLVDNLFLTRSVNSMRQVQPHIIAELIRQLTTDQHKLLIISSSYGAIPTLRGVQQWQAEQPSQRDIIGVMLFSPYLYTRVPPIGQAPEFIAVKTSVPVYIFQAEKNGNRWHFPAMLQHLQQHTPVYNEIMQGVTSLFYDKDNADATLNMLETIAGKIRQRMPLLAKHQYSLSADQVTLNQETTAGLDAHLQPYHGITQPQAFSLQDINGKTYTRDHFKGKVTVINFWASWCPPCVEEIPSLNRLRNKMQGKNFELISINYAESKEHIKAFMNKVAVDFPVLIDPQGKLAGQWQVVAFPSTFVIGPDGKIHFGVNAAILWDTPEVITTLNKLLPE